MDGTVRALRERLAKHLLRPRRSCCDGYNFPAVLFFLPQRLFEGKSIRFVDFVGNVLTNPRAAFVQLKRSILLRHLLHANQDLQGISSSVDEVSKRNSIDDDSGLGGDSALKDVGDRNDR